MEQAVSLRPEVILFDCEATGCRVAELIATLRVHGLETQVVVFNAPEDIVAAKEYLASGASGYVLKSEPGGQVLEALRAAVQGKQWLSPALGAQAVQLGKEEEELPDLNEREQAVLGLLAQGLGNQEIEATLSLAMSTVKNTIHDLSSYFPLPLGRGFGLSAG